MIKDKTELASGSDTRFDLFFRAKLELENSNSARLKLIKQLLSIEIHQSYFNEYYWSVMENFLTIKKFNDL